MKGLSLAEESWISAANGGGQVREFYAMLGVELPDRGGDEAAVPCFANPSGHSHGDRNPSCSVNLINGLWACHGCGMKGNAYNAAVSVGHREARARELAQAYGLFLEVVKDEKPKAPRLPNERQLAKWRRDLLASEVLMGRLEELKGWTPRAIVRCGLGWDGERLTFTVRDKKLKKVGVVRYLPGHAKKMIAMPGSKRLLWPPPELMSRRAPLYLVEGEPAAVSVRSVGLQAVAVPGVSSWRPEFAQRLMPFSVVVLADCDAQGRDLARRVVRSLPRAKAIDLEPNRSDGLDVGDWIAEASSDGGLRQMRRLLEALA